MIDIEKYWNELDGIGREIALYVQELDDCSKTDGIVDARLAQKAGIHNELWDYIQETQPDCHDVIIAKRLVLTRPELSQYFRFMPKE